MGTRLSYDAIMKRLLPAAIGAVLIALSAPSVLAQTPNRAPSFHPAPSNRGHFNTATGPTFIPRINPGPAFRSPTPCCGTFSGGFTFGVGTPNNPFFPPNIGGHHHGFNNFGGWVAVPYAVYPYYGYPYGYDTTSQDSQDAESSDDAQQDAPAPTIFERRSRRAPAPATSAFADSYADAQGTAPVITAGDVAAAQAVPAQAGVAEPTSVLIFRDGHQLEVQNYAIVGDVLYDLTPGHPRKIALASIDIPATVQANDDRGVTFRVPAAN